MKLYRIKNLFSNLPDPYFQSIAAFRLTHNPIRLNDYYLISRHLRQLLSKMACIGDIMINVQKPLKVSIEGNIGSGKSTLINYFKTIPYAQCFDEPLDKWRNCQGHNLLGLLYEDLTKWNSTFQSYVQLTRTQIQSTPLRPGAQVQIFERSVQNNRHCFMENAYRSGFLSNPEYSVLCSWFDWIENNVDIKLDLIVYLRSSPDVVYERIKSRQRVEEKGINREYLNSLHEAHERWLMNPDLATPVCVIDANLEVNKVAECYDNIIPYLIGQSKPSAAQVVET